MEFIMHSLLPGDIWGRNQGTHQDRSAGKIFFPNGPGVTPAAG
jgi:hypothetical protein